MTGGHILTIIPTETVAVTTMAIDDVPGFPSVVQRKAVPLASDVQQQSGRKAGVPLDAIQRGFLGAVEAVNHAAASPAAWSRTLATIAAVAGATAGILLFGPRIEELASLAPGDSAVDVEDRTGPKHPHNKVRW